LCSSFAHAELRVEVAGPQGAERDNVETRLQIRQQAGRKDLDQALVERLHEQAPGDIREALQPFGYYSPVIQADLGGQAPDWRARYQIELGPPTRIGTVDVQLQGEGAGQEAFESALRRIKRRLQEDDRLQHADYEAAKTALADAAYAGGYLDAHWVTSELRVNPDARRADIVLQLDTGPRYYFGKVTLEQEGLKPEVIERYIVLREGDPFDPQKVLEQQFAFSELGYFQTVEIEPQRDKADAGHRVPLLIRAAPRNRSRYEVGVGYGTDTGARLSAGIDKRRLNRYGHTFDGDMRLSEIKNTAAGNYRLPLGEKPGENIALTALTESEKLEDGETYKYVLGVGLNRHPGKWQRRVYLEYTHEESELGEQVATADLLTPGVSFTRTEADDPIYARRGWYLFVDTHGAEKDLLANTRFVRSYLQTRGVYPLGWRMRLLGRMELGANFAEDFSELPASQRFFAGGDQSVRGYDYESIGNTDADGNVIGGEYLATFGIELERRIKGNWGAAVFTDAGGADSYFLPKLYYGAGIGLRYRAPVGSLQLDLAHPFTGDEDGQFAGIRIHIGVRVGL
jgi:translocation and assembly module TamA